MRFNYDQSNPKNSVVKIRKCRGIEKVYCEWGIPGIHEKMAWPFNAAHLTDARSLNFWDDGLS